MLRHDDGVFWPCRGARMRVEGIDPSVPGVTAGASPRPIPMRKLFTAAALSSALLLGACQNPDGSVNLGNTLLLGAGVAALAGGVALASSSGHNRGYRNNGYYNRGYAPQYSSGYGRRGW